MAGGEVKYTIERPSEGLFRDRGSRFIAHLHPLRRMADFEERLAELRRQYHDARHICWAYRYGGESRSNDDGEPAHSAGAPILRQLLSNGLDRAAIYVVRYFGGIKLGVPGLIHAYGAAAAEAIENNELVEWVDKVRFVLIFDYHCTAAVERQLKAFNAMTVRSKYDARCLLEVELSAAMREDFQHRITECAESCQPVDTD